MGATEEKSSAVPQDGWLRAVRKSLGISQRVAAEKAGVSQQGFDQYERGEARATISLESLQRAAAAIDCDLVYFLKPRSSVALSFEGLPRRSAKREGGSASRRRAQAVQRPDDFHSGELPTSLL